MSVEPSQIDDRIAAVMLRYFRLGDRAKLLEPVLIPLRDLEFLRLQWAFSDQVIELCRYIIEHRHEAQVSIDYRNVESSGVIRGRIDASKTLLRRSVTGNPALTVCRQPSRTMLNGPNRVLAWVVQRAALMLHSGREIISPEAQYHSRLLLSLQAVTEVQRAWTLEDLTASSRILPRPTGADLRQAATSRRLMYRRAFAAFQTLQKVEEVDPEGVLEVLSQTLIGPLKGWQRFELLTAMAMGEALSEVTGQPLLLHPILSGSDRPIMSVGKYEIFWQNLTKHYVTPVLEPSEVEVHRILSAYGVLQGTDRPDVVVAHKGVGRVVSVAEAKFYREESDPKEPLRDAITQIVRYSRGYPDGWAGLLPHCIAALSVLPGEGVHAAIVEAAPQIVSLRGMLGNALLGWAERLNGTVTG